MNAIALYAKPSASFAHKLEASKALLQAAAAHYAPLTQASSLGAEDMVVSHLIAETGIASGIFVLDTRMLHRQTLALVQRLEERYDRKVDIYQPDPDVADKFVAEFGEDAMYRSLELRKTCCDFRKMQPLERALAGKNGWITGLRREQSNARAEVHDVEQQSLVINGQAVTRAKINPLADWTWGDVWHFIATQNIPYNPLHDAFFPSIGCAPCTRAVTLGEDFRSGRWWWEQESAKECGLHVSADGTHEAQEPAAFEPGASVSRVSSTIPIRPISP
ncbi:MAG: phosphoadenosine phosphosulfate reductase [Polaromonas sp. 39-63-203]|jgi:phosphoadenosine phosphosulfate reductase|uniref:phosphoadenylyl-sulfate reductase n=1 Tax=Polaromonas sp. TaxID=1869339 RepID=UPI000BD78A18|nr:phosphoadenylyl-sulfate reductase [Polaromonas sp.]OYY52696.1 MAG: phosphoadenosine phosphosulfate reductase [Polaromonas sp. 35-63-240]OYY99278.1 MAG: phosphoadenosine phosphosulfate reductase [Polaromonas sp. 28-63-22]OYZ83977.1 MAG: phosphoadenosine phosphosulfate reductase [Polaromonas sp. 24-62-144]OZA98561.1 MAG: phosphoadenosine phosphosulfate reductase [Polaromonas sp. 39-63-203]HQS32944.1 phosphoadenylyl-sulfate reductase [Polaromonas sp.]